MPSRLGVAGRRRESHAGPGSVARVACSPSRARASGTAGSAAAPSLLQSPEGLAISVFEPPAVDCRVVVRRQGLLSPVGHDLELLVTACTVDVRGDTVRAHFDAASLRVVASLDGERRDPATPSARDRATIERDLTKLVLQAHRFPEIRFESTSVVAVSDGWEVLGSLELHGHTRELRAAVRRNGDRRVAEVHLDQRDFGIQPFSTLFGALKVRPEVKVTLSIPAH